jgi:hypothetical protein
MTLSWSAWILVICAIVSVACVVYGALHAALAASVAKQHAERLRATTLVADAVEIEAYLQRMNAVAEALPALVARADVAVARIKRSLEALHMPEAIAAVRLAGASLRLLFGRFPTPR